MSEQQYSIKETKEVLVVVFKTAATLKEAKANDGKIDFNDAPLLLSLVPVMGPAMGSIDLVPKELGELSPEEVSELCDYVGQEVGHLIGKEDIVLKVNKGLAAIKAIYEFAKTF